MVGVGVMLMLELIAKVTVLFRTVLLLFVDADDVHDYFGGRRRHHNGGYGDDGDCDR